MLIGSKYRKTFDLILTAKSLTTGSRAQLRTHRRMESLISQVNTLNIILLESLPILEEALHSPPLQFATDYTRLVLVVCFCVRHLLGLAREGVLLR